MGKVRVCARCTTCCDYYSVFFGRSAATLKLSRVDQGNHSRTLFSVVRLDALLRTPKVTWRMFSVSHIASFSMPWGSIPVFPVVNRSLSVLDSPLSPIPNQVHSPNPAYHLIQPYTTRFPYKRYTNESCVESTVA